MIVKTNGGAHGCVSAEQHLDGVHLLDADGNIIVIIANSSKILAVEDGEIVVVEQPEAQPTDAERIAELEEALDMLLSGVTE